MLRQEHTGPPVGRLKHLESLEWGLEQICLACSATSEAFGATQTLSAPTEHAKSEEEGRRTSDPLDSLIGGVLVNQRDGFLRTPFRHSPLSWETKYMGVISQNALSLIIALPSGGNSGWQQIIKF